MSSKRLCISLLHAPSRSPSHQKLPQCSLQTIFTTARGDCPQTHHHRQRQPCRRYASAMSASRQVSLKQPPQPSMAVAMKKQQKAAMRDGSMLEAYGMLPGTIVRPTGKNLPSWMKDPRGRLALEWHVLNRRVMMMGATLFTLKWRTKPAIPLETGKIPGIAKDMYEDMYKHFAQGDLTPLEGKLSPGLMGSLRGRVSQRQANTFMKWRLERYLAQPKLVWYHVAMVDPKRPKDDQLGLIQAVVRIRSRQSLQRVQKVMGRDRMVREIVVDSEGKAIPDEEVERERRRSTKDTTEYLVLQRFLKHSRTSPWQIWGTTEEMSLAKIKKAEQQLQEAQRLQKAQK